jgi:N-acyl-D-aspartate/D-glutamate deacylase
LSNARVIDGTGRPAVERATIVMRNGRIEAFGANAAGRPGRSGWT